MSQGIAVGEVIAVKKTDKALLVRLEDGAEVWVPQSQIHEDSEVWQEGQAGSLIVNQWYAEQKGWA